MRSEQNKGPDLMRVLKHVTLKALLNNEDCCSLRDGGTGCQRQREIKNTYKIFDMSCLKLSQ